MAEMFSKIAATEPWGISQDFRITPYICYAHSSLFNLTIAEIIALLWDLFALNNLNFYNFFLCRILLHSVFFPELFLKNTEKRSDFLENLEYAKVRKTEM